jgi:hypothetical protein
MRALTYQRIITHLHLVHSLLGVPVKECLAPEHCSELVRHTFEQFLDGSRVADKGNRHLETARSDVALGSEDVVRDPLDKVGRVLVLHELHLLFDILHRDLATEDGSHLQRIRVAFFELKERIP